MTTDDPRRLRIVVVGHSLVVPSNRARWERLAELHPDVDVTLIAPAAYQTSRYGKEQRFTVNGEDRDNFRVRPIQTTVRNLYRSVTLGLRGTKPHVLQVNAEPTEWALLQVFLTSRILAPNAVRLFYYFTNILAPPDRWDRKAKLRAVLHLADGGLAGSSDAERVLRALGFRSRVFLQTEIGADERVWAPPKGGRRAGPFKIGFVGALLPQKGVADLARAVLGLRGNWRLVIVGDGPERKVVQTLLREAGVEDRLDLRGVVERESLPALMRELDVHVLPSRTMADRKEQFGLVLAEAMLSGVAVVGSDSGAIPEVIGDGGLIFREGDHRALADQLRFLMEHQTRRERLAMKGRERALHLYSASALAEQTYELYRQLTEERCGRDG